MLQTLGSRTGVNFLAMELFTLFYTYFINMGDLLDDVEVDFSRCSECWLMLSPANYVFRKRHPLRPLSDRVFHCKLQLVVLIFLTELQIFQPAINHWLQYIKPSE